ncbi:hypothetical protein EVAR_75636_1 [Eumeta japonica]|uniref:Uncharacterized protein n=1 Tax=Eumeta variegata TaxID=151549 RepID=A0A4C1U0T4_EUMVA|nr:hypothetical protein EVAR_75636_1 [Eumeta japonica]
MSEEIKVLLGPALGAVGGASALSINEPMFRRFYLHFVRSAERERNLKHFPSRMYSSSSKGNVYFGPKSTMICRHETIRPVAIADDEICDSKSRAL